MFCNLNIMIYFNKLILNSNHSVEMIIDRLKQITHTGNVPFRKFNFSDKIFYGQINKDSFKIQQVWKSKNSFLLYIEGEIIVEKQTKLNLKMRLNNMSILFSILLLIIYFFGIIPQEKFIGVLLIVLQLTITFLNYVLEFKKVFKIFTQITN